MQISLHHTFRKDDEDEEKIYPVFFRLHDPVQYENLINLLNQKHVFVHDYILSQVEELIKIRNPNRKLTEAELAEQVLKKFNGQTPHEYGVWVYYPWSHQLVHILDKAEFIELRTNRNIYKITPSEREILSTKKVGVIGLSVGQSVSLTMAMERSFGEIRIADFDCLELSNMNRIRTGLHNIGLSKVTITAREIAEIDPFLKVTCFYDGITESNIDAFMGTGGNLDVVIDECDSFDIKVLCREKAKQFNIPVLMEASDRGTVDIERHDLEPDRPLFHGNLLEMSYTKMKAMSREERMPYINKIIGNSTVSQRMKYSFPEIGKTISAWPQLASAVVLGGGISADVYRRICLGQIKVSGRFFVDLDELIRDI